MIDQAVAVAVAVESESSEQLACEAAVSVTAVADAAQAILEIEHVERNDHTGQPLGVFQPATPTGMSAAWTTANTVHSGTCDAPDEATKNITIVVPVQDQLTPAIRKQMAHYEEIRKQEARVAAIEAEWEEAKENAKTLKAEAETARGKLLRMIRLGADTGPQRELPLGDTEAQGTPAGPGDQSNPVARAEHAAKPAAPDAWRELSIAELGLSPAIAKKLAENEITTLGKFSDRVAKHGEWWFRELKGIGETKAAAISEAFVEFWANHPEYCQGGQCAEPGTTPPAQAAAGPEGCDGAGEAVEQSAEEQAEQPKNDTDSTGPASPLDPVAASARADSDAARFADDEAEDFDEDADDDNGEEEFDDEEDEDADDDEDEDDEFDEDEDEDDDTDEFDEDDELEAEAHESPAAEPAGGWGSL